MAYTRHGHHIPGTSDANPPEERARCGGLFWCPDCAIDSRTHGEKASALLEHKFADDINPMTVPLVYRDNEREEHIGTAIVEVVNGIMKIVGISMVEDAMGLLDLGGSLHTIHKADGSFEGVSKFSISNNRPNLNVAGVRVVNDCPAPKK